MEEYEQLGLFDEEFPKYQINKPIRLIELFAGVGSQSMALKRMGVDFESYIAVEFDDFAIKSYNSIHRTDFPTLDVTKIHAEDLAIKERDKYEYILFYSFPCTDLSLAGKQAGNSICVNVLCAIFSQLNIQGHKNWNSMSLEERRELVYKGTVLEARNENI